MYKYSILMYNFNGYEIMREPLETDPECEYVYVTDNPTLTSNVWKIIVDKNLDGMSPFDKCDYVRYHPFEYLSTDICISIDGSTLINKSLNPIYKMFIDGNYDAAYTLNIWQQYLTNDYKTFVDTRGYSPDQANRALAYLLNIGRWNFKYKGYLELYFRIIRNTKQNRELDSMVYTILKELGEPNKIDRLDQPIYAYVLQKYFPNLNILPFSRQLVQRDYLTRCFHNSNVPDIVNIDHISKACLYNKVYDLIKL